jgi:hypothetical protein
MNVSVEGDFIYFVYIRFKSQFLSSTSHLNTWHSAEVVQAWWIEEDEIRRSVVEEIRETSELLSILNM